MLMSLASNQLDAFMAVAQSLNFTRAAAKLNITQSALSQRILNLEDELKISLFIRDRAGLKLTEEALDLIRYCQTKNSLEAEFIERIKSPNSNEMTGVVKIGGFSSVMRSVIQPSIRKILIENKKLRLHLMTAEMSELPDMLKRGKIDYMVLDDRFDREELEKISLGFEYNVLVQKKKYEGAEIFLDHDPDDTTTAEYLKLAKRKIKKIERRFLDDIYGLLDGVTEGLGVAVLPLHLLDNRRDLEIINPELILKIPVSLYFYRKPFYSKLHHALVAQVIKDSRKILFQD